MSAVKQTCAYFASVSLALGLLNGCSSLELARFAPPGIIKQEDIASEKPPNPAVQAEIDKYRAENTGKYPILSETPVAKAAPSKPPQDEIDRELAALNAAGETLAADVEAQRTAVEAAEEERQQILNERKKLREQVERGREDALTLPGG